MLGSSADSSADRVVFDLELMTYHTAAGLMKVRVSISVYSCVCVCGCLGCKCSMFLSLWFRVCNRTHCHSLCVNSCGSESSPTLS